MRRLFFTPLLLLTVFLRAQTAEQRQVIEKYFLGLPVCSEYNRVVAAIDSGSRFIADNVTKEGVVFFHYQEGLSPTPFPDTAHVFFTSLQQLVVEPRTRAVYDTTTAITVICRFGHDSNGRKERDNLFSEFTRDIRTVLPYYQAREFEGDLFTIDHRYKKEDTIPCITLERGFDARNQLYYLTVLFDKRRYYQAGNYFSSPKKDH